MWSYEITDKTKLLQPEPFMICFCQREDPLTYLISTILDDDMKVLESYFYPNGYIRSDERNDFSIRVYAENSSGKRRYMDIMVADPVYHEIQAKIHNDKIIKSCRHMEEENLPVYIILLSEKDLIGAGVPIFTIDSVIEERENIPEKPEHIVYVNCECKAADNQKLLELQHDLCQRDPEQMYVPVLRDALQGYLDYHSR